MRVAKAVTLCPAMRPASGSRSSPDLPRVWNGRTSPRDRKRISAADRGRNAAAWIRSSDPYPVEGGATTSIERLRRGGRWSKLRPQS
jgi:hypothetical protein